MRAQPHKEITPLLKSLGQRLKQTRRSKGLTQTEFSHKIKLDYRHYQAIEGGKVNMRLETFLIITKALEMPVSVIDELDTKAGE